MILATHGASQEGRGVTPMHGSIFIIFPPWSIVEEKKKRANFLIGTEKKKISLYIVKKLKHFKRMDDTCHIPEFLQAFSCVENGGLIMTIKEKHLVLLPLQSLQNFF